MSKESTARMVVPVRLDPKDVDAIQALKAPMQEALATEMGKVGKVHVPEVSQSDVVRAIVREGLPVVQARYGVKS